MEGHNNFSYIPDELSGFDGLIQNSGWPAEPSQQHQQQQQFYGQQNQDPYTRFTNSQQTSGANTHGHYSLNHPQPYSSASFSNSPYASQYQHARPSDVFGPTSYNVDPSLQASSFHGHEGAFSFQSRPTENATIAPQSLQYGMNHSQQQQALGSAAFRRDGLGTSFRQPERDSSIYFQNNTQNGQLLSNQASTIRYPTLRNDTLDPKSYLNSRPATQLTSALTTQQNQPQALFAAPPPNPLRTTHPDLLAQADTTAQIPLQHAPFLAFEDSPVQVTLGLKNTIPKYRARKSRSGKDILPGLDLFASSLPPTKTPSKRGRGRPPKVKPTESQYTGTSQASRALATKTDKLRAEGKSPSTPTETSSSEEESDSSEESEYEEDDMPVVDIKSIRGETRPTNLPEAARYDAIGIIWKDDATDHGSEAVKDAIEKFAAFLMAQRVQIKANAAKMETLAKNSAAYKELEAARGDLLASLYETINATIEHGYDPIVQNLGGHHKLVNGLTGTLIDCNKAGDMKGRLPRAVFKLLAKFRTMSDDLLLKLKFDKLRVRWQKLGDEDISKDIETILANTTNAQQKANSAKQNGGGAEKEKTKDKVDPAKVRTSETISSQPANSAKRPHEADGADAKPSKKIATEASKPTPIKRIGGNLLGISSKPVAKSVPKKREASPPQASRLGALLASIEKPKEAPKTVEAPTRPPETPEEKARRERKESRRHLRVKFKEGAELEQIKLFTHERAEDEGRQDEMLKDAHDDRSEGMMHKQSKLNLQKIPEDEDDYEPSEADIPYQVAPLNIINQPTTRGEVYVTRSGSLSFTTPEQEIQRKREGTELMVVYTSPDEIPPTPKELTFANTSDMDGDYEPELLIKTPTEPWLVKRLQEIQQYGPEVARHVFAQTQPTPHFHNEAARPQPSAVPGSLQSTGSLQHPQKAVNHMDPAALANILRIVNSLKNKPYPPTEPPDWMTDQAKRDEWTAGYLRDNPVRAQVEAPQSMAPMHTANIPPPQMFPQQFAQPPPQMTFQGSAHQPPIPPQPQMQQMQAYPPNIQAGDYGNWAGNPSENDTNGYTNQSRWEGDWDNENDNGGRQNKKQRGGRKSKPENNFNPFDERGEYKGKKKPCRFFQEGKCAKGAACTYLHDE